MMFTKPRSAISGAGLAGLLLAGFAAAALGADLDLKSQLPPATALEPDDALASFRPHPGFRVELVAA